uniref:Transmembrane protein n=1 Tax=Cacopsylla melanoneura TaxID=428564 RepID=A0A8D8LEX4_9HEMI
MRRRHRQFRCNGPKFGRHRPRWRARTTAQIPFLTAHERFGTVHTDHLNGRGVYTVITSWTSVRLREKVGRGGFLVGFCCVTREFSLKDGGGFHSVLFVQYRFSFVVAMSVFSSVFFGMSVFVQLRRSEIWRISFVVFTTRDDRFL